MGNSHENRIVVVGGGMGGMAAAIHLASSGYDVTLLERQATVGGKMSVTGSETHAVDSGPTVLTMRWVFDALFASAGARFCDAVPVQQAHTLARHSWEGGSQLDLYADEETSARAITDFAGAREAAGYRAFCAYSRAIYAHVQAPFIQAQKPHFGNVLRHFGPRLLGALKAIDAFRPMHTALRDYFRDPRLLQLFGRYATYAGGSPYQAPATLNLIAHVEQQGVWYVQGGMQRLASAMAALAEQNGVVLRYNACVTNLLVDKGHVRGAVLTTGETIRGQAVVFNGEPDAAMQLLPKTKPPKKAPPPALSALTWTGVAQAHGFNLMRHNVFFADPTSSEFADIFSQQRIPTHPTVYVCAQDRDDGTMAPPSAERLLCLVNAPATVHPTPPSELDVCQQKMVHRLAQSGLTLTWQTPPTCTTPHAFAQRFPCSHGALYGTPPHTWRGFFSRGGSRSRMPGLYLAGGSVHPGPGVPMATLSGRLAAQAVSADCPLITRSPTTVTRGGTSTPKVTTDATL